MNFEYVCMPNSIIAITQKRLFKPKRYFAFRLYNSVENWIVLYPLSTLCTYYDAADRCKKQISSSPDCACDVSKQLTRYATSRIATDLPLCQIYDVLHVNKHVLRIAIN